MFMHKLYINGILCNCTEWHNGGFYADNPDNRLVRCSFHRVTPQTLDYVLQGGIVKTGGNTYSKNGTSNIGE